MGIPIKRIFKTVTKQVPDIVDNTVTAARVPPQSIKTVTPTSISMPRITDVFPNQTVTNRLGVPIGIGSDVNFENGKLVGTIFSGDKRYDLSKIYDDFDVVGLSPRSLNDYMFDINNNGGITKLFKTLPLTVDFKPQLEFNAGNWRQSKNFTPETYKALMESAGYTTEAIRASLNRSINGILEGKRVWNERLHLLDDLTPDKISEHNFNRFTPEHIIQNMDENIASRIFYTKMLDTFEDSRFDLQSRKPIFNYTFTPVTSVQQAASDFLTQKYPGLNFDMSMNQFIPEHAGQNIPTIEFLRQRNPELPFDFQYFSWTQGKIPKGSIWGTRGSRPNTGWNVYKDLGQLKKHVPRGYAITETNTSPDSEVLKLAMVRRNYGINPGQSSVKIIKERGSRNEMQNNTVWFEDLLNDPQIPQNEKVKLLEIQQKHGIRDISPEWYDSETYKRAQTLYHQKAAEDMRKLLDGWRKVKKLDSNIGDISILVDPFSKYQFQDLFRTGSAAPHIYSPHFHIIKHKNGGSLLNHLQNAIEGLKNNNKFGN